MLNYKYDRSSAEGRKLIILARQYPPNPIKGKCRVIPLDNLKVGDSLFFRREEMLHWKFLLAKETAMRYNRRYNNMFGILLTEEKTRLEIVRIK